MFKCNKSSIEDDNNNPSSYLLQDEKTTSSIIDRELIQQHNIEQHIIKLLLLGASESGKSTIFKQLNNIYGSKLTNLQRNQFIPIIHKNIIHYVIKLCELSNLKKSPPKSYINQAFLNEMIFFDQQHKQSQSLDSKLAKRILLFWNDQGIQHVYENDSYFQTGDSVHYFMNRILLIAEPNYIPTDQDIVRSRQTTTSIVENTFTVSNNTFKIIDVGGQRSERKKWIHCFQNVVAVLFVAAINEYDQVLVEDSKTNRLDESLKLFGDICNNEFLKNTAMILFLNKKDLFAAKLQKVPLANVFPDDYADKSNNLSPYQNGIEYMKNKFENMNQSSSRQIYIHVTCATDTNNVQLVFNDVKDIVIQQALKLAQLC